MAVKRQRFVIVGGGTAGWLAALMLRAYAEGTHWPLDITVVESSAIPTIGVGEGTTAVFRQLLERLGIDEAAFLRGTGATIKLGIRHKDWRRVGHAYDGPIDDPHSLVEHHGLGPEQASALDIHAVAKGEGVADHHLFGQLMRARRVPFARGADGRLVPAGPFHHAYHFDQAKAGAYLRERALHVARGSAGTTGIEHRDAAISGLRRDGEGGAILALRTEDGGEVAGDFFIDCTGFRRALIGEMGARFVSYAEHLPVNRAMPFWLPHDEGPEGSGVPVHTLAWAQRAGWMWAIPTAERIGCGYVYHDGHATPDDARVEIERALGRSIEPRADLRFETGRLDEPWRGNCLALGLASSFLEPLEATSIHGTVVQMMVFTTTFARLAADATPATLEKARAAYNAVVGRQVDDFRGFLNLHYVTGREEPFWREMREERQHPDTRERLARWSRAMPTRADFARFPGLGSSDLPHVEEQLYYPVLDGLGLLDKAAAREHLAARPKVRAHARKERAALTSEYRRAAARCMTPEELLKGLVA